MVSFWISRNLRSLHYINFLEFLFFFLFDLGHEHYDFGVLELIWIFHNEIDGKHEMEERICVYLVHSGDSFGSLGGVYMVIRQCVMNASRAKLC